MAEIQNMLKTMPTVPPKGSGADSLVPFTISLKGELSGNYVSWNDTDYGRSWFTWKTPATVQTRPGVGYCFTLNPTVSEQELAGLADLQKLPGLAALFLDGCLALTDEAMTCLQPFTQLARTLSLKGCFHLGGVGLCACGRWPAWSVST